MRISDTIDVKFQMLSSDSVQLFMANHNDSGWDLTACYEPRIEARMIAGKEYITNIVYDTGIRVEFPEGYCGFVYPRSSIKKYDLFLSNSVGVIDEGYRGSIQVSFRPIIPISKEEVSLLNIYQKGDRIAQLVITKRDDVRMVEGVVGIDTVRSTGGFGSSNKA